MFFSGGTKRKTTLVGLRFWGPNLDSKAETFLRDSFRVQNLDPKMESTRRDVFGAGALSKNGQQVSRASSACFGCACAPFVCPLRWLLQPTSHFCELERPLSARLIFGPIFGHHLGPLIDPFCCWTVAGSALCFGKEDQPTPQFVALSLACVFRCTKQRFLL